MSQNPCESAIELIRENNSPNNSKIQSIIISSSSSRLLLQNPFRVKTSAPSHFMRGDLIIGISITHTLRKCHQFRSSPQNNSALRLF